jgi:hypothetical protein
MEAADQDCWQLVATAQDPERLFPVRSNQYCAFYADHLPDGTQVLVGRTAGERIVIVFFGKWTGSERCLRA